MFNSRMMDGTKLKKWFLCASLYLCNAFQCSMIVSQSGVIFSQDDNIILSGPDNDKLIIHLALEMPNIQINEQILCESTIDTARVDELRAFSVFAKKWFLNLLETNLNKVLSVEILNLFIEQGSANVTRGRRSFDYVKDGYFLLSSWTEDQYAQSFHYNDLMFQNLEGSLDQMKIRIFKTNQSLKRLSLLICRENRRIDLDEKLNDIKMSYLNYVKILTREITMAQIGNIPTSIPYTVLTDLCVKSIQQNPDSHICNTVNLRTFFVTTFKQLLMDKATSSLILEIELTIPRTPTEPYSSFRVYTIPSFVNNTVYQVESQAQAVGISLKSQKMIAVNNCYKVNKLQVCNNPLSVFESLCLNKIYSGNNTDLKNFCDFKVLNTRSTCFVQSIKKGLLISAKKLMPIHKISQHHALFSKSGNSGKGIFIIPNMASSRMAIRCQNEDFSTRIVNSYTELNITIHRHDVSGLVSNDQINVDIRNMIENLSVNISDRATDHTMFSDTIHKNFYAVRKNLSFMQYILIICVVVIVLIICGKCYRFGKFMYEKYQKHISHREINNIELTETTESTKTTANSDISV